VLEALGAYLKTTPEQAKAIFEECGFVFLHAQVYHPAMRYVAPVRGELGIRTIFNVLGPLANPAGADKQLLGVYSKEMVTKLANVLARTGTKRLVSVHGEEGLDEVSPSGKTYCCQIFEGEAKEYVLTPQDFGLTPHKKEEIVGGDPAVNADIMLRVLGGEKGAYRDAAVANSSLALYISGKAKNPYDGARLAEELIDSGKALNVLQTYIKTTKSV
jgi:anthranilate phosphoribosyltransferase